MKFRVNPDDVKASNMKDPGPGKHLWIIAGCWRVDPESIAGRDCHLDIENLLSLDGPGCFKCEQHYSPELAAKPCSGSMM